MTKQSKLPNKNKLLLALKRMNEAKELLNELKMDSKEKKAWTLVASFAHYENGLSELISCDDGEAGFEPMVAEIIKEIK